MKIDELSLVEQLKMLKGVSPLERPAPRNVQTGEPGQPGQHPPKVSFGEMLENQLRDVSTSGVEADKAIERTIRGEETSPHHTILAIQKATLSLSLMMNIKDRLERAYQELIRTPIG